MKSRRFGLLGAMMLFSFGYPDSTLAQSCGCGAGNVVEVEVSISGMGQATIISSVGQITLSPGKPSGRLPINLESGSASITASGQFDGRRDSCDTAAVRINACGIFFSPGSEEGNEFYKSWEAPGNPEGLSGPFNVTTTARLPGERDSGGGGGGGGGNGVGVGGGEVGSTVDSYGLPHRTLVTRNTGGVILQSQPFSFHSFLPLGYDMVASDGRYEPMGNVKLAYSMESSSLTIDHFRVASSGFNEANQTDSLNKVYWQSITGSPRILVSPEGALRFTNTTNGVKAEMFARVDYSATTGAIGTGAVAISTYRFDRNPGTGKIRIEKWIRAAAIGSPTSVEEYEMVGGNFVEVVSGMRTVTTVTDDLSEVTLTGNVATDEALIRAATRTMIRITSDLVATGQPVVSRTIEEFAYIPERQWNSEVAPPTLGTTIIDIREVRKSLHHDLDGDQMTDTEEPIETWTYYGENTLAATNYALFGLVKYHATVDGGWELYGYDAQGGSFSQVTYRPWKNTQSPNLSTVGVVTAENVPSGVNLPVRQLIQTTNLAPDTVSVTTKENYIGSSTEIVQLSNSSSSAASFARTETDTREYTGTWTPGSGNAWSEFSSTTVAKPNRMVVTTYGTKDAHNLNLYGEQSIFRVAPGYSKQEIEIYGQNGLLLKETRILPPEASSPFDASDFEVATRETYAYDTKHRLVEVKRDGRVVSTTQYLSDRKQAVIDEQGRTSVSEWDVRGRLISVTVMEGGGVGDISTTYEYAGLETRTKVNGYLVARSATDLAGRSVLQEDQTGGITTWSYTNGGRTVTMIRPDTGTEITTTYRDGRLASLTGTGVVAKYYDYTIEEGEYSWMINNVVTEWTGGPASDRKVITIRNTAGEVIEIRTPNAASGAMDVITGFVGSSGTQYSPRKLASTTLPVGGNAIYPAVLNDIRTKGATMGMHTISGKVQGWGLNQPTDKTRLEETHTFYLKEDGYWWEKTTRRRGIEAAGSTVESSVKVRLWQEDGSQTVSVSEDGEIATTTTTYNRLEGKATSTTVTNRSTVWIITETINGHVQWRQERYSSNPGNRAIYTHDNLGRVTAIRDHRGGVSRILYNAGGQMIRSIDTLGRASEYTYVAPGTAGAGRIATITKTDGYTTVYTYDLLGQIATIRGTAEYPQDFTYNVYGERETLTTFNAAGSSVTRWEYNAAGLVATKYEGWTGGTSPSAIVTVSYVYDPFGRMLEKSAGGRKTSYTYTIFDEIETIDYGNNGGGADVTLTRDAAGNVTGAAESYEDATGSTIGGGTTTYAYTGGRLDLVSYSSGHSYLPDVKLDYKALDAAGRSLGYLAQNGTTTRLNVSYTYDVEGRLGSVGSVDGASSPLHGTATYAYHPGSGIISGYTVASGATLLTQSRPVDFQNRTSSVTTKNGSGQILASARYSYDMADRRIQARREDGTYWNYGYNPRGEVAAARRYTPDDVAVWGLDRTYQYDAIGNRSAAAFGVMGEDAEVMSPISYTVNAANQYTSVASPNRAWVVGKAPASQDVAVNGELVYRQGEWFSKGVDIENYASPARGIVNITAGVGGASIKQGKLYVPKEQQSYSYDAAGNVANDGRWEYEWDSENRLRKMKPIDALVTSSGFPNQILEFVYDWQGRRIAKKVTEGSAIRHTRYLYEGWNVVAEWTLHGGSTAFNTPQTYLWGLDLIGQNSGDARQLQGAGGIGGLIAADIRKVSDATPLGKLYASYDGNGNILAWSGTDGLVKRTQDYDAFGNVVIKDTASSSLLSAGNGEVDYGFSTKPEDQETGLLYYGHRYYDPVIGRWPSRDPIEEEGGLNLYGFVKNRTLNGYDYLGMEIVWHTKYFLPVSGKARMNGYMAQVDSNLKRIMKNLDIILITDMAVIGDQERTWFSYANFLEVGSRSNGDTSLKYILEYKSNPINPVLITDSFTDVGYAYPDLGIIVQTQDSPLRMARIIAHEIFHRETRFGHQGGRHPFDKRPYLTADPGSLQEYDHPDKEKVACALARWLKGKGANLDRRFVEPGWVP